jgi:hypothetical protein
MSRFSVVGGFEKGVPEVALQKAQQNLTDMLARSINIMLNRFPAVDNVVLVGDGGSWRKQLPIPTQLKGTKYKGNREQQVEVDWEHVFNALNDLMTNARGVGVTVSQTLSAEGDDWVWYWSRRLNAEGTNVLIWSIDRDLQQLVQKTADGTFTAWYSDRTSQLCLPECYKSGDKEEDPMDFFMTPLAYDTQLIDSLKAGSTGKVIYVNPDDVVIEKVLCGDSGDNIKAVVRFEKGGRTYRFSEGDLKKYQEHDLPMTTVGDLKECREDIADWIMHSKKFSPYKFKKKDIIEMLDYNIKLVWLNEETIPAPVIQSMNETEYKQVDVGMLRNNYRLLAKTQEDTDIESIFEEI